MDRYPEARYLGVGGEISVTYRSVDAPPDLTFASGTRVHYLATGSTTHGLFGLFRWEMASGPGGATPHFHRGFTESFFVIDGSPQFYDGRRWVGSEPGAFVHVPEGGIHGFRNESGATATMLIHFSPGAPRERYFEEIQGIASMDDETRAAFFIEHDNHLV
jgi:mannose-6-phosphate isomerase-like protein (cupin superfamily)